MLAGSVHATNVGAYRTAFARGRFVHYKYCGCRKSDDVLLAVYVHRTSPGKSFAVHVKFENFHKPDKVRAQVYSRYQKVMSRSSVRTPWAVPAPVAAQTGCTVPSSAAAVTAQSAPFVAPVVAQQSLASFSAAQAPSATATHERKIKLSMLQDDLQDGLIDKDTYRAIVEKQYMS
jgi:hypothetical protein